MIVTSYQEIRIKIRNTIKTPPSPTVSENLAPRGYQVKDTKLVDDKMSSLLWYVLDSNFMVKKSSKAKFPKNECPAFY